MKTINRSCFLLAVFTMNLATVQAQTTGPGIKGPGSDVNPQSLQMVEISLAGLPGMAPASAGRLTRTSPSQRRISLPCGELFQGVRSKSGAGPYDPYGPVNDCQLTFDTEQGITSFRGPRILADLIKKRLTGAQQTEEKKCYDVPKGEGKRFMCVMGKLGEFVKDVVLPGVVVVCSGGKC